MTPAPTITDRPGEALTPPQSGASQSGPPQPGPPRSGPIRCEVGALLTLGIPVIGAQLAQISMNFVDTLMAGRLSPRDLAGVSLGASLWMPIFVLGLGVLMSVGPTVAHCFGAGEYLEIGRRVRQGLWLSVPISFCCVVAMHMAHPVFGYLEVDPAIIPTATGFLRAVAWGMPALCVFNVLRGFSEAVSMTRPILFICVIGTIANVVGNYVFMYGHFGMPQLGAIGCGVATAVAEWIMLGCLVAWIGLHPYYRQFEPFSHFEGPDLAELWKLVKLGAPIGVSLFMEGGLFGTVGLLLGRFGESVVSGHQIAINVASVTFMVPLGIAMAVTVRVGQALGARDPSAARRSGTVGAGLALAFMTVAALVMAIFPRSIAALYTSDPDVQNVAVSLLRMAAIFQIFDGLQVAGAGALRGLKDTAVPMGITFLAYWGIGLPLAYALGITWAGGPQAMWIGLIVGLVCTGVLLNARFQLVMRRRVAERLEA